MRDIAAGLAAWNRDGVPFAIATVVQTWQSAPRQPGAAMAVAANGDVIGSVSGGCVEGAVYELAQQVISDGHPVSHTYGVSDDDAIQVGLTCGGTIEIFLERADGSYFPQLPELLDAIAARRAIAVATVLLPGQSGSRLIVTPTEAAGSVDEAVVFHVRAMLAAGITGVADVGDEDVALFVQSFAPPPLMLIFGATDLAVALARIGKSLDYQVTVCDARSVFATSKRFPEADEVVVAWPHLFLQRVQPDDRTVICVLTHDPKFDDPLLQRALRGPARYIGALGSRKTHQDRLRRLRDLGLAEPELSRLHSPIGLNLGARSPEEIAIAIAAEVIAQTHGGSGERLTGGAGPIHH